MMFAGNHWQLPACLRGWTQFNFAGKLAVNAWDTLRFSDKCLHMPQCCPRYVSSIWEPGLNQITLFLSTIAFHYLKFKWPDSNNYPLEEHFCATWGSWNSVHRHDIEFTLNKEAEWGILLVSPNIKRHHICGYVAQDQEHSTNKPLTALLSWSWQTLVHEPSFNKTHPPLKEIQNIKIYTTVRSSPP